MTVDLRNDEAVQKAARFLFEGVVPERRQELKDLWDKYQPRFNLLIDAGPEGLFVMDAGAYREVRFNHRAMRAFWLAAYIAWEGYVRVHEVATTGSADFARFDHMLSVFNRVLTEADAASVLMPDGVPEPGVYPGAREDPNKGAPGQLATFATGWALLHEIRHLQHQQAGTGAPSGATPEKNHEEELSCDEFATRFIMEKAHDYARSEAVDVDKVLQKRELGVYFAMFAMTLIGAGRWEASSSHPAMQARIDAAIKQMGRSGTGMSDAVAHAAFAGLWRRWPDAPGPFVVK